jgi:hypothetical protein
MAMSSEKHWAKQQDIFSSFSLSQSFATTRKRPQLRIANPTKPIWTESRRAFGNLVGGANPNFSFTYTVTRSFRQENDADEHGKYILGDTRSLDELTNLIDTTKTFARGNGIYTSEN